MGDSDYLLTLWLEGGLNEDPEEPPVPVTLTYCYGDNFYAKDVAKATFFNIESMEYRKYGDNPDLGFCPNNYEQDNPVKDSRQIFPDKQQYNESEQQAMVRRWVIVRAEVYPAEKDVPVYFHAYDVDEPLTDDQPVDKDGTPAGPDNRGEPQTGTLLHRDSTPTNRQELGNPACVQTFIENGRAYAEVILEVTLQPGDNFRVLSSERTNAVSDHQDWADNPTLIPHKQGKRGIGHTPMITVWRRLHVEIDSMAWQYDVGFSTDLEDTRLTDINKNWDLDQFNSYLEDWELDPNITYFPPTWFDVTDTWPQEIEVAQGSEMTAVADEGDPYMVEFKSWGLDDLLRGDIPQPLDSPEPFKDAFKKAYVEVVLHPDNDNTPWHFNFGGDEEAMADYLFFNRKWQEEPGFWYLHFMGAYDDVYVNHDNDQPDQSELCNGAANVDWHDVIIFYETRRDEANQWQWSPAEALHVRQYSELHEAGHKFIDGHSAEPTDVMWAAKKHDEEPIDREEELRKDVPLVYSDPDIDLIRRHGLPPQ